MARLIFILFVIGACFLLYKFGKHFKNVKCGSFVMFTGGVKCGKSTVSFNVAYRTYKRNVLKWRINSFMHPRKKVEKPLLYSNIPLAVEYVPLTEDLLLRKKRFNYKSVIFIDECSLVADSMSYKDEAINDELRDWTKLIGHETQGGTCIVNTHCINDLHFAFKRTTSNYYYVDRLIKWIPFLLVARIVEQRYSDDGSIISVDTEDVADKFRWYVFSKRTWKLFDCYAFSKLTDGLARESDKRKDRDLKTDKVIRFRK